MKSKDATASDMFFRIFRYGLQHFWRNGWLSLIITSMLALTLMTMNVVLVLSRLADTAIDAVQEKIEVSVYFQKNASDETIRDASNVLRGLPQVRDVSVVSPQEALERFKERHRADEAILASLDELPANPFGSTLVVKVRSAEDFSFVISALEHPQFSDQIREKDFSDYASVIERVRRLVETTRTAGVVLAAVFLLIAVLIIFNTVRMSFFIYREEIGIMKLVGASNAFVQGPFFVEAALYSICATIVSAAIAIPMAGWLDPLLAGYFGGVSPGLGGLFLGQAWSVFGLQLAVTILICVLSTLWAMRKYLKV